MRHHATILTIGVLLCGHALAAEGAEALALGRWTPERGWTWYSSQPWLVGFNYIPATAINTTEMWQADTFDPKTIDAELALAEQTGFNCARVFLQYVVWENDPKGHERRMEQFLSIAQKHNIRTLFVLFDECAFSTMTEPFLGKQPDVIPGEYANGWTPSPGPKRVLDRAAWPKLEAYVRAVVGRFRDDPRVLGWDVYNEPSNTGMGNKSLPLVEAAFAWARQANPSQPLTAGVWGGTPESTRVCLELSDVISFHSYAKAPELERKIAELRGQLRPILCTEWLNRPLGSVVESCLPVLARQRVGAFHWGLVNGKTQTQFPWGSKAGAPEPKVWQHDLFRKDRTPYDEKELTLFRETIRQAASNVATNEGQWPAAKAWAWHSQHPWLVGCNFLPSTAVNDVEMWQNESFDPKTIERELGWAQDLGFSTVRVFVNYAVWEAEADALKDTFRQFLKIADKRGISTLVILFDDCFKSEPRVGKQAEPEPGVHNSQWVQSPGATRRGHPAAWPKLEQYVKDMVGAFASDKRVLAWELYNEPSASLPLVEAAFRWAREARPTQPVTTTIFGSAEMQKRIIELSDVLCFHNYGPLPGVKAEVARLLTHGRPVLCTEWMARGGGSRFETHLPFFKENTIACWNWGLVAGRTQTYFPWGSPKGAPEPKLWHHDILRTDGTPFKASEVRFIKVTTGRLPASALPRRKELVPTAEKSPVPWRYTLEKPAGDWFKVDFNDAAWKQGAAPFGREETPIARQPNTVWTSADIWARREFEMPASQFTDLALLLHHDEDTEVYINGVMAVNAGGYNAAYEPFDITPEARAALKPGRNMLAVHSHQTIGGQYLDLGIEGASSEASAGKAATDDSTYRDWKSLALRNGLIELQVVPEIGGRIIQFRLGGKEFLWVNPQLAGQLPPSNGLAADGGWFNVGGYKLWPAPQGWDNNQQWPGPPDAVLDGQPYALEKLHAKRGETAIRLTSGKDPRSGIQFSRVVRLFDGSTRVSFKATMKNVDTKPRRWGLWAHTQLDGAKADGSAHNPLMRAWCPLNPQSKFPQGYAVIFGQEDNPSFQPDPQRGLMRVQYQYQVGKIGLDSRAGWVATVDGVSGAVFVQRFAFEPKKEYPDGASVEFWLNGVGQIHAYNKDMVMSTNAMENPYVFESEVLSPFAELKPGQSYTWRYDWYACNIGGEFPVLNCTDAGVVAEPLVASTAGNTLQLHGRFGVFAPGLLQVVAQDARGRAVATQRLSAPVTPLAATTVNATLKVPASATTVTLTVVDATGRSLGELARAAICKP
jgi:hypothetical protein